jgi:hypothetical protein
MAREMQISFLRLIHFAIQTGRTEQERSVARSARINYDLVDPRMGDQIGTRYFRPEGAGKRQEYLRQSAAAPVPPSSAHDTTQTRRPLAETLDAQLMLSVQELSVRPRDEGNDEGLGVLVEEKAKFETERCEVVGEGARINSIL